MLIRGKKVYFISFIIPIIILTLIFAIKKFNTISNLTSDLYFQYIDFFSWFQNQLKTNKFISPYSFSISLGNASIPLVAYYLASPLNFLIIFFNQETIPEFVLLTTALKIGLSGLTMYCYLDRRFEFLANAYKLCGSTGYALMYYNITQATNLMWLDGVYMLPLILLGAYQALNKKSGLLLSLAICSSIIFNWYTAYMNCLFVFIYFIYELSLRKKTIKEIINNVAAFCLYEISGILLSCFFFLPVILGMLQSKTSYETAGIINPKLRGNILEIINGFFVGNIYTDTNTRLSLFCGTAFLILLVAFFLHHKIKKQEKLVTALFLGIMILSTQIIALENIWNGFRYASSFYCRFSYIVTFLIIFIGMRTLEILNPQDAQSRLVCSIAVALLLIFSLFDLIIPRDIKIYTICVYFFSLYIIWAIIIRKRYAALFLFTVTSLELLFNGIIVYRTGNETIGHYKTYVKQQNDQMQLIRLKDDYYEAGNFFRIEETMNRQMVSNGISAAYNDAMSYNYHGLANYASTTYSETVRFASDLGYYEIGQYIIPYSEPILASDSLLGIRYVMSHRDIPGFSYVEETSNNLNNKNVYFNPYALPLGIRASENILDMIENDNPFLFQNEIYSKILGEECQVFKPLKCTKEKKGNSILIDTPLMDDPEDIIYIYANTTSTDLPVYIDEKYRTNYNCWLSYQTICVGNGENTHTICFEKVNESVDKFEENIYYLDMDCFKQVIAKLKQTAFNPTIIYDGYIEGDYWTKSNSLLLLTVPFDTGWKVSVNNKPVTIQKGMNSFIAFPVGAGENHIVCEYHIPGIKSGIIISLCGLFLVIILEKKRTGSQPPLFFWRTRK